MVVGLVQQATTSGQGGARPNSGPEGNGFTHAANVDKTNAKNAYNNQEQPFSAQSTSQSTGV